MEAELVAFAFGPDLLPGDQIDGNGKIQIHWYDYYTMSVLDPSAPWFQKRELSQTQYPSWRIKFWRTLDAVAGGGDVNVYITVADEAGYKLDAVGNPIFDASGKWYVPVRPVIGIRVMQHNGGDTPLKTRGDPGHEGEVDFNQTAQSSFDPAKGQIGPYSVDIFDGKLPSETAYGMGLPLRNHRSYLVGFQKVLSAGPVPPPPGPPPPTPPPGATRLETAMAALNASRGAPTAFNYKDEAYFAAGNMDTGIIVRRPRDGAVWMQWPEEL